MATQKLSQHDLETTRLVVIGGVKTRVRKVTPSKEAIKSLGEYRKQRTIIGHMAINRPEVEKPFRKLKADILREMALMHPAVRNDFIAKGVIDFVKDKGDRKRYDIFCSRCGEKVAYCWAADEKLHEWVDLHYITSFDRESWKGAMAINVSPIDGKLGIECACGEDTRDFRAARSMPPIQKQLMTEYSMKHRDFGVPSSRFLAMQA